MRPSRRLLILAASVAVLALPVLTACDAEDGTAAAPSTGTTSGTAPDASAPFDPCKAVTAAEIGKIVGFEVTSKEVPGGGCQFDPVDDPRATSVAISLGVPADLGGGIESSKQGTSAMIAGTPADLPGVGDAAYLVVGKGKVMGTGSFQAQAGLQIKGQLITITLTQLGSATETYVAKTAKAALTLVASKVV